MPKMSKTGLCLAVSFLALAAGAAPSAYAQDASAIEALKIENSRLQKQLKSLMARMEKVEQKTDAVAAKADDATAQAEKAVTVTEKGAFKIPGTGTTVKLGGYIKADAIHDFSRRPTTSTVYDSTGSDAASFSSIPTRNDTGTGTQGSRHGATRFHARQSRVNLTTNTPTAYGPLETVVEADFWGTGGTSTTTNSYGLRLRRAFATYYGFLAGQEWTSFGDNAASPELLDFNGPAGQTSMRQAQLRYTHDFANGHFLTVALENPESDVVNAGGTSIGTTAGINYAPDVVLGWKYQDKSGHIGVRAVGREIAIKGVSGAQPLSDRIGFGYGLAASGRWKPFAESKEPYAKDSFMFLVQGGNGIGRYVAEAANYSGVLNPANKLDLLTAWGVNVGMQHFWANSLRSTVVYGRSQIIQKSYMGINTQKIADSVHANLIWSPVPSVDLGVEYLWGHRVVHNNAEGFMNRLQASAAYRF